MSQSKKSKITSDWILAKKSSEPVVVTTDSIEIMKTTYNNMLELHIIAETAHLKDMIAQEVKRLKSWLNLYK